MADFSINAELKANASQFVHQMKQGETSVNSFGSVVEKVLGAKGKLVMALTAATAAAVKFGQAMNSSMSEIAKGTGKTGEELYKLRENVHDSLVNGVARSAKEVGTMIADLNTRFGVTGKEVVALTTDFDKFAKVTGTDTKTAINLTADAMKKWDIDVADTNKLLDQLTVASQESGAGVDELLSGLKSGQAVFSQFGMSATDTIAFMSSLKSNGIETSQALVAMRTALAKFSQEGINAKDGFAQVSEAIKNAKTQTEALNIATNIFGTKNGAEMVKVLQSGASSADELKAKLLEAGGAVERTNEAARTSKEAFNELKSIFEGTFGGLAEGLDQLFKGVFDTLSAIMQTISPIIRPIMNTIRDLLGFIGDLTAEIAKLIGDSAQNSLGFKSFATALQSTYEMIHNILGNMLEVFKSAFGFIFAIMNGQWELAWLNLKKIFVTYAKSVLDLLSDLLNGFKDQINVFIEKVINPFIEKINVVQEWMHKDKTAKVALIDNFDLSKATGINESLNKINKKIKELSGKSVPALTGELGEIKDGIKEVKDAAEETAEETSDIVEEKLIDVQKYIDQFKEVAINSFGDIFTTIGEDLVDQELSWQNCAATAVEGVAQILSALGAELAALAAARAANYDYGTAVAAAAGSAAAFVASGVLTGVAKALKKSAEMAELATESLEGFNDIINQVEETESIGGYVSSINLLTDTSAELQEQIKEITQSITDQNNAIAEAKAQVEGYNWGIAAAGLSGNFITAITLTAIRDSLKHDIESMDLELKQLQVNLQVAKDKLQEVNDKVTTLTDDMLTNAKNANKQIMQEIQAYQMFYSGLFDNLNSIAYEYQLQGILGNLQTVYEDMQSAGANIGEIFVDGILEGATETDFLQNMKDFVRDSMIKLAVYTEEFNATLASKASELVTAITNKDSAKIASVKDSLKEMYAVASENANAIDSVLDDIFGKVEETVEDITETVEDAMDTIGTDISNSLIDALTNGLDNGDFLETMKKYIRKMVIQTVVYTDTLQGEIEAIGEAISLAIADGFTDTGLEEIRRDFSYIFYQAESAMSKVDSMLDRVFDGYATGTNNATAGLHLVGEAGPELVRFRGGEQVYNANDTAKMLNGSGGVGNSFNVVFNNMQDTSAFAMMQQLKAYQREMAINGVI